MRLTVIVPAYNVAPYLADCVQSLTRSASRDFSVLVVDDGSTDGTGAIADRLAAADERVTVLHQPNSGVSAARNAGMAAASADWLWFVDGDDLCAANTMELLLSALDDREDVLCFRCRNITNNNAAAAALEAPFVGARRMLTNNQRRELLRQNVYSRSDSPLASIPVKSASFSVYRSAFLKDARLTFPTLPIGQDSFFHFCALREAKSVGDLDAKLYLYRRNGGSVSVRYMPNMTLLQQSLYNAYASLTADDAELSRRLGCRAFSSARICLCLQFSHADSPLPYRERRQAFLTYEASACKHFAAMDDMGVGLCDRMVYRLILRRWFAPLNIMYRLYTRKWRKNK